MSRDAESALLNYLAVLLTEPVSEPELKAEAEPLIVEPELDFQPQQRIAAELSYVVEDIPSEPTGQPLPIVETTSAREFAEPEPEPSSQEQWAWAERQAALERLLAPVTAFATDTITNDAMVTSTVISEPSTAELSETETVEVEIATPLVDALLAQQAAEVKLEQPVQAAPVTLELAQTAEAVVAESVVTEPAVTEVIESQTESQAIAVAQTDVQPLATGGQPPMHIGFDPEQTEEFQALFFTVAGLTLAVPLMSLGGIAKMSPITSVFGHPKWYLGMLKQRDSKLNVVDTRKWVMPERAGEEDSQDYRYVIQLAGSDWALACDSLKSPRTLTRTQVNWRKTQGKRPWLAGMIKEPMCALINVDLLIEMLKAGLNSQQELNRGSHD